MTLRASVDKWMIEAYSEPWRAYFEQKKQRGELTRVRDVWVDVPNVIDRIFTCEPSTCSPKLRKKGQESCCAEFQVELTKREIGVLEEHFDGISRFLEARDKNWKKRDPALDDVLPTSVDNPFQRVLGKRKGRCALSFLDERGAIQCGVHGYALAEGLDVFAVKPKLCFLFPLLVQDLQDGTWLITVIDEENSGLVGFTSFETLPCMWGEKTFVDSTASMTASDAKRRVPAPPFYDDHRGTLTHLFGRAFMTGLDKLARERGRVVKEEGGLVSLKRAPKKKKRAHAS